MLKRLLLALCLALVAVPGYAKHSINEPSNHHPVQLKRDRAGKPMITNGVTQTTNWSGYVVLNKPYLQVSGRWQVPSVTWGQTNQNPFNLQYNTIWIGIGGFNDSTLIQMGTETTVNPSNQMTHYLWYELYPAGSVGISGPITAGDVIEADIHCTANCTPGTTQTWQMTIKNDTQNWGWSQSFSFASTMVSAEWVVETPYYNGFLPLNNYVQANWDSAQANNVDPGLTLSNGLSLASSAGQTSNPSDTQTGNAFSTCYGWQTFTPCTFAPIGGGVTPPPVNPAPTATLSAQPNRLTWWGQTSNLTWASTNATTCTGSGFNTNGATSGSVSVAPTVTTNYGLSCTGAGGTVTTQVTITFRKKGGPARLHGGPPIKVTADAFRRQQAPG